MRRREEEEKRREIRSSEKGKVLEAAGPEGGQHGRHLINYKLVTSYNNNLLLTDDYLRLTTYDLLLTLTTHQKLRLQMQITLYKAQAAYYVD